MAVHLSRHPDLQTTTAWRSVAGAAAVEESCACTRPTAALRAPPRATWIPRSHIEKDEPIALLYASATATRRYSPMRPPSNCTDPTSRHLAFGRGRILRGRGARALELQVALEELLKRTRHFEVDGEL